MRAPNSINFANTLAAYNVLSGTPSITVNAPTTFNESLSGAGGLVTLGATAGSNTITLSQPNNYVGVTAVNGVTLEINNAGTLNGISTLAGSSASTITVGVGGNVILDNSSVIVPSRLNSDTVNLAGGVLAFLNSGTSSQFISQVNLVAGNSTIASTQGTGSGSATIGTLTHCRQQPSDFQGSDSVLTSGNGNQIIIGTLGTGAADLSPSPAGNIMPYATLTGPLGTFDFASYSSGATGVTAFANYNPQGTDINSANAGDVFMVTSNQTLAGNVTVAAFLFTSDSVTVNGPAALFVGTGAIATTAAPTGDFLSVNTITVGTGASERHHQHQHRVEPDHQRLAHQYDGRLDLRRRRHQVSLPTINTYSGATTLEGSDAGRWALPMQFPPPALLT